MADGVSGRDLDALRGLLALTMDDPGPMVPWELVECLRDLFHSDLLQLARVQPALETFVLEQALGETQEVEVGGEPAPQYWELYRSADACSLADRTGDIAPVTKLSDFVSDRQWRDSQMYIDYCFGRARSLMAYLPDEPGYRTRLYLWRGPGRDFDERERLLLTLLRPHLSAAYRAAERRRRPPAALTTRQVELLQYVAQGYTNTQIARRMQLSEGTVRTHLNHIYERLGVTSRTAAATRMSTAGLE